MPQLISTSKDLLLLLLYAKGTKGDVAEPIVGRTRLMKMVFLFDQELRRDFVRGKAIADSAIPTFEPYDYGPFSPAVYADLEFLVGLGFIRVTPAGEAAPEEEEAEYEHWRSADDGSDEAPELQQFALSATGRRFVESGRAGELSAEQQHILDEFKVRCTGTSLSSLLRYVYSKYPDTTTKSKIRDRVVPRGTP